MPEAEPTPGERRSETAVALAAIREVVALIDAGELTATAAQRGFLLGAIAAQDNNPLLYK